MAGGVGERGSSSSGVRSNPSGRGASSGSTARRSWAQWAPGDLVPEVLIGREVYLEEAEEGGLDIEAPGEGEGSAVEEGGDIGVGVDVILGDPCSLPEKSTSYGSPKDIIEVPMEACDLVLRSTGLRV